jgi:hypothetical protein
MGWNELEGARAKRKEHERSVRSRRRPPLLKLLGNVEERVRVKLEASLRLR